MDYFLKAATEAALQQKLIEAAVIVSAGDAENRALMRLNSVALDTIGTITRPTGNMIADGDKDVPETAPIPGFHANLRGVLSDTQLTILEPILLPEAPTHPFRVWG